MEGYDEATYGERVADVYDDWFGRLGDLEACVDGLFAVALTAHRERTEARDQSLREREPTTPRVLELGIGTGRIALPLAARGLDVRGIDSSPAMLDVLAGKDGADELAVAVLDMSKASVPPRATDRPGEAGDVDLAFVAYNTFFNLSGPDAQRRCLEHVAALLAPTGRFVVEAFVPDMADGTDDRVTVRTLEADRVILLATVVDQAAQTVSGQYIDIRESGIRLRPWELHYLEPAQLDELAAVAGLELEHRWADFAGIAFDPTSSPQHISIYRRA